MPCLQFEGLIKKFDKKNYVESKKERPQDFIQEKHHVEMGSSISVRRCH